MLDTMYNASGIGLAAVQVGILSRIVVIDTSKDDNKKNPIVFINPKIINNRICPLHEIQIIVFC